VKGGKMHGDWMKTPGHELSPGQKEKLEKLERGELHLWDLTPAYEWTPETKEEAIKYEESLKGAKPWDTIPGYDFNPVVDLKVWPSWFMDGTHSVPPWTPLYDWLWEHYCCHGQKVVGAVLSFPRYRGVEDRTLWGGSYTANVAILDEEEVKQREVKFREAMRPYIEDFDGIWERNKKELLGMYEKLKAIDLDKATNIELLHHQRDLIDAWIRMWEIHFLGMQSSYGGWLLLEELLQERFGITDESPEFQKMVIGFDNKVYQVDRQMWELGLSAIKKGLEDTFLTTEPKDLIPKLEQSERGREWLKEFHGFLDVEGWRMVRMNELLEPYWLESPSVPLDIIKGFIKRGGAFVMDEVRAKLAREREEAIAEMLKKVHEEEREWFMALVRLAGKASSYSEEHDLYCELYIQALLRRGYLGIGRRLAQSGTIDRAEDVFFLIPEEVERVIMMPEIHDLRHIVNRRREPWRKWQKRPNPPVITLRDSLEEGLIKDLMPDGDPIMIKIVIGRAPVVKPELKADVYGTSGSPGVAEGTARVVMNYDELYRVQEGDILVSPATNPAWTPAFGRIKAAVVDRGGTLSHSAIIGREFGIPVVVNCFVGTMKIKDGQKIRVNGTEGTVYILEQ
jgi:pyruvate,water dikinase